MTPLSFTKYSAHPSFTSVDPKVVKKIPVKQLRALVWYHAATAGKGKKHRCPHRRPRKWKREQLLAHAATVLNGHIRLVGEPDMAVIMTQYNRECADDDLVATLLASVNPAPAGSASANRRASRRGEHKAAADDDRAEGEEVESDHARSDSEQGAGEGEEGEEGGADDDEAAEEKAEDLPAATAKKSGSTTAAGASTASKTTTKRPSQPTHSNERLLAYCIACSSLNDITFRPPSFCSECAHPWGVPVGRAPRAKASTADEAGTATATTTPTAWADAARFKPAPISALGLDPHSRAPGLAGLDEKIIKHAREGKQHYALADLLQLRAEDRTAASSVALSESAILFDPREGTLTSAVGAAATSARSAAARRRTITGFSEISETIFFSLIGTIYVDRPDIGQQLLGLLIIAQDLTRSRGWTFALDYVEAVRLKFYHSTGGPCGRHCLAINSEYNMGKKDADVLFDTKLYHHGSHTGKENTPSNANRGELGDGKLRKTTETCRGWNSGTCARKPADCRYAHRCSTCNSMDHSAPHCVAKHRTNGQAAPGTTAAGPGANRTT